jgi:hypothetical protein
MTGITIAYLKNTNLLSTRCCCRYTVGARDRQTDRHRSWLIHWLEVLGWGLTEWTSTRNLRYANTSRWNTKTAEIIEGSIFVICPTHLTRIIAILTRYIAVRDSWTQSCVCLCTCAINCVVRAVCMKGMYKDAAVGILTRSGWSYKLRRPINLFSVSSSCAGDVAMFCAFPY